MKCWLLWHGGANYAPSEIPRDLEPFDTLREAINAFDSRADSGNTYYPCVEREPAEDGGQSAWIFLRDPSDERDPYPDRILEYGSRGGLRMVPA